MQTHEIQVSGAESRIHESRCKLFAFPEVLDVFATGRPDALVVVYWGRPRPGEWLCALRAVGYRTPARSHARWPGADRPPGDRPLRTVGGRPDAGTADDDQTASSRARVHAA
jgi:hypothetical protein